MAHIHDSFDLERVIASHPEVGTYIIDEASFFDERIAYVVRAPACPPERCSSSPR
jgi:thymidine kinase